MKRITSLAVLVPVVVVSLASLVGCGAHPTHAAAPSTAGAGPSRDESMWSVPEETSIVSNGEEQQVRSSDNAVSFRPNVQQRPTRGAIHAAY